MKINKSWLKAHHLSHNSLYFLNCLQYNILFTKSHYLIINNHKKVMPKITNSSLNINLLLNQIFHNHQNLLKNQNKYNNKNNSQLNKNLQLKIIVYHSKIIKKKFLINKIKWHNNNHNNKIIILWIIIFHNITINLNYLIKITRIYNNKYNNSLKNHINKISKFKTIVHLNKKIKI